MKICNTCGSKLEAKATPLGYVLPEKLSIYRMQGVDTGEAESSFTAEEELKKIKCNNCGKFRLVPYPEPDIIYCCTCGKKIDKKPERNPWLWKGCICEVWDDDVKNKRVMYFSFYDDGSPAFCESLPEIEKEDGCCFKHYRVTGTPLDFVPDWAAHIVIDKIGYFSFESTFGQKTGKLKWRNCPKHLLDMNLPIPDWALNGGGE